MPNSKYELIAWRYNKLLILNVFLMNRCLCGPVARLPAIPGFNPPSKPNNIWLADMLVN